MDKLNPETAKKFEEKTWMALHTFLNSLPVRVRDDILYLMELEYERGHEDGYEGSNDDICTAREEGYDAGYDAAMEDYTTSRDEAYEEGYAAALQAAQDAILHIGR